MPALSLCVYMAFRRQFQHSHSVIHDSGVILNWAFLGFVEVFGMTQMSRLFVIRRFYDVFL
jgi:hypothetical protein